MYDLSKIGYEQSYGYVTMYQSRGGFVGFGCVSPVPPPSSPPKSATESAIEQLERMAAGVGSIR